MFRCDRSLLSLSILIPVLLVFCFAAPVTAGDRLRFGLFPYLSAQKLAALHQPLKDYLAAQIDASVDLVSAPDLKSFMQRTESQEYDLILTAPHMGRLAEKQGVYQPVAHTSNLSFAVFAVWNDAPFKSLEEIKGQTVVMPPKQAIIHHLALDHLRRQGLDPAVDIKIVAAKSHNSARQSLLQKETRIAVFGRPTWDNCSVQQKSELRILATSDTIPGFMLMVKNSWTEEEKSRLSRILSRFSTTAEGQKYFSDSGLKPFVATDEATMRNLDPYVKAIFNQ